jgi:NAD(P)-dependent dehydrogenase (short-subunit alcohol dehydrogenase family)
MVMEKLHMESRHKGNCDGPCGRSDLGGKVAIVTGSGRGIGAAIAVQLAAAGAHVMVNDRVEKNARIVVGQINEQGGKAIAHSADLSKPAAIREMFLAVRSWGRQLDIVVCNAAITNSKDIFDVRLPEWEAVFRANVTAAFLCAKYGMQQMRRQKTDGRIIFIGSGVVHQAALTGYVAYAASKGAIHSMAKTLARTAAPFGITVNTVAPGMTDTALLRSAHSNAEIESIASRIPLGIGLPEDVAAAVAYLASDAARHVTGITLDINGGQIIR